GAVMSTALAGEAALGRGDALPVLHRMLNPLGSLYKSRSNHFDGYILRYDAVTNGDWRMVADTVDCASQQKPLPQYSAGFPIGRDGWYDYSPPLNDPRYCRPVIGDYNADDYGRYDWKLLCRAAEPS